MRSLALAPVLVFAALPTWAQDGPLIVDYQTAAIEAPPVSLGLDPFYKKYTDALGIAIVGSEKVPNAAMLVARDIVIHMLANRSDLRAHMCKRKIRVCVMAQSESTTDLPEQRNWKKPAPDDYRLTTAEKTNYEQLIGRLSDKEYWDRRARGMGGNPTSCAEENLLGYSGTRYFGENILVHEFAHGIMDIGVRGADRALFDEIHAAYKDAKEKGLWKGHYGSTNANEYWAEGTQTWFWSNYEYVDGEKRIQSPDDLKQYDPKLYELLGRVYGDHHIPMDVYHAKNIRPGRRRSRNAERKSAEPTKSNDKETRLMPTRWYFGLAILAAFVAPTAAADPAEFPAAEFVARRAKVAEAIGAGASAVLQGAPPIKGFEVFRQSNELYYLTGITVPGAYVQIEGGTGRTLVYLPKRDPGLERAEGPVLSAEDGDAVKALTGCDEVLPIESLSEHLTRGRVRTLYTPFSPAEGRYQSRGEIDSANRRQANDPWDSMPSREAHFVSLLKTRVPRADIRDLTPILDPLRVIKSPGEVARLRRAGQLSAEGVKAAIRSAKPGVFEYQLDAAARYVHWLNGAMGDGYRPITATGKNASIMHYYKDDAQLKDGELVLMDFSPEVGYYTSDIGRMFPVNGVYTPQQRELYGFVVEYHKTVLRHLKPGVTAKQVMDDSAADMERVLASWKFSKPIYETGARNLLRFRGHLSHGVGMAVHDVGRYQSSPLAPGMVFAVDPQMFVPEEKLYIRIEDTVAITATGYENLTGAAPIELDDVEKLMKEPGIVQAFPPLAWPSTNTARHGESQP
jgi:Xaa-Pro aminopeptidase